MTLFRWSVQSRLLIVAALMLVVSTALISWLAFGVIERELAPVLEEKAVVVGDSVVRLTGKMVGYGIPLERMRGMESIFGGVQAEHDEIAYLAIKGGSGAVLYEAWHPKAGGEAKAAGLRLVERPLLHDGARIGTVVVGIDGAYAERKMSAVAGDIVTVVVVSGLLTIEVLVFLIAVMVTAPLASVQDVLARLKRGDLSHETERCGGDEVGRLSAAVNRAVRRLNERVTALAALGRPHRFQPAEGAVKVQFSQRLLYIRLPLFLLIFAESMSLSFFPLYVRSIYEPIAWLPKEIVIGLPISIFMLFWALSLPFAGQWSDRVGRRRTFLAGALLTAVGLVLSGLAEDMLQLLLWRSLTAVGYGVVFITAQGYVTDNTTPENRTKGMALFLSGFFSGSLCGAAIGGILSDRIGYSPTFFLSALLAVASAMTVHHFLEDRKSAAPATRLGLADFKALFSNKYFLTITFFAAVPAKIALTGFLYYAGPLYLMTLGESASSSGRILMTYGLAIIIISPLAGWLTDRLKQRQSFVALGGLLSGVALLAAFFIDNWLGMLVGVMLLGVAHAIGVAPQLTLITELQSRYGSPVTVGKTIGIFRLTERIGNITGPLVAATLIATLDFHRAFVTMGLGILVSVALFFLLLHVFKRQDERLQAAQEVSA